MNLIRELEELRSLPKFQELLAQPIKTDQNFNDNKSTWCVSSSESSPKDSHCSSNMVNSTINFYDQEVIDQEKLLNNAFEFIISNTWPKFMQHFIQDIDKDLSISIDEIRKINGLRKYERAEYWE